MGDTEADRTGEWRAGELAKQMMQPHGSNQHGPRGDEGTLISSVPKEKVQEVSGFSERQLNTAVRIANIPAEDFERRIESDFPPSVTALRVEGPQHQAEAGSSIYCRRR